MHLKWNQLFKPWGGQWLGLFFLQFSLRSADPQNSKQKCRPAVLRQRGGHKEGTIKCGINKRGAFQMNPSLMATKVAVRPGFFLRPGGGVPEVGRHPAPPGVPKLKRSLGPTRGPEKLRPNPPKTLSKEQFLLRPGQGLVLKIVV
jgi:hypothetical protein